ncbi:unnamed protein product [Rangifer tarandus platyrhynchus]|uniref:Uncharacterized protein n=1 Tax=Rangifer tarandus platyrhynchus TaxID=3082113 RepID=A0ABN8Y4Y0_RANTA|nr:unnamed protein product [Rangifer tarandus platyrhynchus]
MATHPSGQRRAEDLQNRKLFKAAGPRGWEIWRGLQEAVSQQRIAKFGSLEWIQPRIAARTPQRWAREAPGSWSALPAAGRIAAPVRPPVQPCRGSPSLPGRVRGAEASEGTGMKSMGWLNGPLAETTGLRVRCPGGPWVKEETGAVSVRPDGDLELGSELARLTLLCLLSLRTPGTACAGVRMAATGDGGAEATCPGPLPKADAPDGSRGPGSRPVNPAGKAPSTLPTTPMPGKWLQEPAINQDSLALGTASAQEEAAWALRALGAVSPVSLLSPEEPGQPAVPPARAGRDGLPVFLRLCGEGGLACPRGTRGSQHRTPEPGKGTLAGATARGSQLLHGWPSIPFSMAESWNSWWMRRNLPSDAGNPPSHEATTAPAALDPGLFLEQGNRQSTDPPHEGRWCGIQEHPCSSGPEPASLPHGASRFRCQALSLDWS